MKKAIRIVFMIFLLATFGSCNSNKKVNNKTSQVSSDVKFNSKKDFLLLNYDCKTDVDDLHSVAAAASLVRLSKFSKLNYHAVAGSYGVQGGKYVPANTLFELAFGDLWSDAHSDVDKALNEVFIKVEKVLNKGGNIWIADAGQSDFSASLVSKIQKDMKQIDTKNRIHIVQHSNWNEKVTGKENLAFVKTQSHYHKIPDGNALNNGTPGFNNSNQIDYKKIVEDAAIIAIWDLAVSLANTYNGAENRYLNKSIKAGGMDFSDFCEVHYILQLKNIDNGFDYFNFLKKYN